MINVINLPTQLQQSQSMGACERTVFESSLRGLRELESIAQFCDVMVTPYHDDSELERTYQQSHQSALNHSLEKLCAQGIGDWLEASPLSVEDKAELSVKLGEMASGIDALEQELYEAGRVAASSSLGSTAAVALEAKSDAYRVVLSSAAFADLRTRTKSNHMVDPQP